MDNTVFSNILRNLLNSREISQKWLADEADTTEATISRYLSAKNQPEITIVIRIAKALKVSVDYLCGLTDSPTPRESLGAEALLLLRCYDRADMRDKKVLWTILEGYMKPEEKEWPISSSYGGSESMNNRSI